jgi:hypothetical protein
MLFTKSDSDYEWRFKDGILAIEDLNLGKMSVTNNMENVLTEIRSKIGDKILDAKIVYRDSEGSWGGVIPEWTIAGCSDVQFYFIEEKSFEKAIKFLK